MLRGRFHSLKRPCSIKKKSTSYLSLFEQIQHREWVHKCILFSVHTISQLKHYDMYMVCFFVFLLLTMGWNKTEGSVAVQENPVWNDWLSLIIGFSLSFSFPQIGIHKCTPRGKRHKEQCVCLYMSEGGDNCKSSRHKKRDIFSSIC